MANTIRGAVVYMYMRALSAHQYVQCTRACCFSCICSPRRCRGRRRRGRALPTRLAKQQPVTVGGRESSPMRPAGPQARRQVRTQARGHACARACARFTRTTRTHIHTHTHTQRHTNSAHAHARTRMRARTYNLTVPSTHRPVPRHLTTERYDTHYFW